MAAKLDHSRGREGDAVTALAHSTSQPRTLHALTDSDRARARETVQAQRERRVDAVLDLMSRGEWAGLASHRALASQWGCSVGAVQDYAATAHAIATRLTRLGPEERADAAAEIIASCEAIRARALAAGKLGDAIDANALIAKLRGLYCDGPTVSVAVQVAQLDEASLSRQIVAGVMARPDRLAMLAAALASLEPADRDAVVAEAARTVTVDADAPMPVTGTEGIAGGPRR